MKDIFYQQQFLQSCLGIRSESISQTKAMETRLGNARDCDLALAYLAQLDPAPLTSEERQTIRRCIKRKREHHIGILTPKDWNLIAN